MLEQFDLKRRLMHSLSEISPVDKSLKKRADWILKETGVEGHLQSNGQYLDVGTGKGHIVERILEDMEESGSSLKGYYNMDIADKPLEKVQRRELSRKDKGTAVSSKEQNPMNFAWATAEALPFADESLDGVSFFFSIHHMDKNRLNEVIIEAKRVLKENGKIFIVEDVVDSEEERSVTEKIDRKINWEDEKAEHNYKSDEEWQKYFNQNGLKIVDVKFFESKSKKGTVRHASYVLKIKPSNE